MKKILVFAMIVMSLLSVNKSNAQVNINVNIGSQPGWGPVGYNNVMFYYIPDLNCYYDIARASYIFLNSNTGNWYYTAQLPSQYSGFDLYNHYKVVVNRARPYERNRADIANYAKYKGNGHAQALIRDAHQEKYFQSKDHPQHNEWVKQHPENNNGNKFNNGQGRGNNGNGQKNNNHQGNNGRGNGNRR